MSKSKVTVMVDDSIYEPFKARCQDNDFRISEVIVEGIAECNTIIGFALERRERELREAKEAQILKLQKELGYSEADMKKLLKNSKPAEPKPAKKAEVLESRQAHKGTYEGETVLWEVDRYNTGYFCRTSDGKIHKKDVNGNIVS